MAKVIGRTGKAIDIQMLGINEVIRNLQIKGKQIEMGADFGVVRAGGLIEEEVKESIAGNRVEPKSVTTGQLANSIIFDKTGKAEGVVKPKKETYPGTSTTTEDTALFMEYGTSTRPYPRSHFRNTKTRNQDKVEEIIESEIKKAI